MVKRKFIRKKEDFICERCGAEVKGDGYTNHCPKCLWSKHVDVDPGDRASACLGLMAPVRIESGKDSYAIIHRCIKCGYEKRNKVSPADDFSMVVEIQRAFAASRK